MCFDLNLWRVGATAVVTVAQGDYLPSIDGSVHRSWLFLVDFEGVHLISALRISIVAPVAG